VVDIIAITAFLLCLMFLASLNAIIVILLIVYLVIVGVCLLQIRGVELMMKCVRHLIVISKHKVFVMIECFKLGLYWQGLVHDLSKFGLTEFIESAKYFQGTGTPINVIKVEKGYSAAWLHHKGRNKHHWEYWTDFYFGEVKPVRVPERYLKEMACDMIGASRAYLKGKYNPKEPLAYFEAHVDSWCMSKNDKQYVRNLLTIKSNE